MNSRIDSGIFTHSYIGNRLFRNCFNYKCDISCPEEMAMIKVLIADDEEDFLKAFMIRLEDAGLKGTAVSDGEQVFEQILIEKPDIIVLDVMMPKMDGLQVTRRLKEKSGNQ